MLTWIKHSTWLTIILCATSITHTKVIIWDLDTLIKPNDTAFAREVGTFDLLRYGFSHRNAVHTLKHRIYTLLARLGTQQGPAHELVRDSDGEILPQLLSDFLAGKQSGQEALNKALATIAELKTGFFETDLEKRLITSVLTTMLTPALFARTLAPVKQAVALLKKCAASYDNCGNANIIIIAPNLDTQSFEYLFKDPRFKTVFNLVKRENMVVSGALHLTKPKPAFFQHILTTYKVKPTDCIFIDDQEENIKAAQALGMTVLHEKDKNYKQIEQELRKLCVLQPQPKPDDKKIKKSAPNSVNN